MSLAGNHLAFTTNAGSFAPRLATIVADGTGTVEDILFMREYPHVLTDAGGTPALFDSYSCDGLSRYTRDGATWAPSLLVPANGEYLVLRDVSRANDGTSLVLYNDDHPEKTTLLRVKGPVTLSSAAYEGMREGRASATSSGNLTVAYLRFFETNAAAFRVKDALGEREPLDLTVPGAFAVRSLDKLPDGGGVVATASEKGARLHVGTADVVLQAPAVATGCPPVAKTSESGLCLEDETACTRKGTGAAGTAIALARMPDDSLYAVWIELALDQDVVVNGSSGGGLGGGPPGGGGCSARIIADRTVATVVVARVVLGADAAVTEVARLVAPEGPVSLLADGSSGKLSIAIGAYVEYDAAKPGKPATALRTDVRILNVQAP